MCIMIKGVCCLTTGNVTVQTMHRHIHGAQLRIKFRFLLTVEGHFFIGLHAPVIHKVACLHKHAAAATGRVEQNALLRLNDINNQAHKRLRREEYSVVLSYGLSEFTQKIFINPSQNVAAHIIQKLVIKVAQKRAEQLIIKFIVGLGQHALKLPALRFQQAHDIVERRTQRNYISAVLVFNSRSLDIFRQAEQIAVACLFFQKQSTFRLKMLRAQLKLPARPHRMLL